MRVVKIYTKSFYPEEIIPNYTWAYKNLLKSLKKNTLYMILKFCTERLLHIYIIEKK
jgi:hypothetical protein